MVHRRLPLCSHPIFPPLFNGSGFLLITNPRNPKGFFKDYPLFFNSLAVSLALCGFLKNREREKKLKLISIIYLYMLREERRVLKKQTKKNYGRRLQLLCRGGT
jgi:hypothetical protein